MDPQSIAAEKFNEFSHLRRRELVCIQGTCRLRHLEVGQRTITIECNVFWLEINHHKVLSIGKVMQFIWEGSA